jgi:hypothetical protein
MSRVGHQRIQRLVAAYRRPDLVRHVPRTLHLNLAGENRLRAAAGGDKCEKGTLLISRLDFAVNSISIPVIR